MPLGLLTFFTGKLIGPIASAAAVVLLGLLIAARIQIGFLHRDVARLDDRINNPKTGFITKLEAEHAIVVRYTGFIGTYKKNEGIYKANEVVFRTTIANQTKAVAVWKAEATRRVALANGALRDRDAERAAGQKLAAEILALAPTANAALDADLFILRAVTAP